MPIIVSIFAYSITSAIVLAYIGQSGEYAVAGYGAGTRLEQVLLLPILGINTAIISIISQNFGANQIDRIKEAYFTSIKYSEDLKTKQITKFVFYSKIELDSISFHYHKSVYLFNNLIL